MPTQEDLNNQSRLDSKSRFSLYNGYPHRGKKLGDKGQNQHIYTVSELTQDIKLILENTFASVWVEGEISNFTHHLSGHMYFSLKDENAVISACLFRNVNQDIKFKLENGLRVICLGQITVYGKRGQYQIVVKEIEPKGIGALQLAFQQLKKKLYKEGLFDSIYKKPIPAIPFSVGIVTSQTGAAIRDILKILTKEVSFLHIVLRSTLVQGENAKYDIAKGIAELNQYSDVDIIILARGGGSLEDLWPFNEEIVARAIFNSKIPVVSAIGHEVDITIADLVADLRTETPTSAAKLIVNKKNQILSLLEYNYMLLAKLITEKINNLKERLGLITASPALKHPLQKIEEFVQDIDNLTHSLSLIIRHMLLLAEKNFFSILEKFKALNPVSILARGFSLTTNLDGKIIKKASSLNKGQEVITRLTKGSFQSKVVKILKTRR